MVSPKYNIQNVLNRDDILIAITICYYTTDYILIIANLKGIFQFESQIMLKIQKNSTFNLFF
jgi:hypothetical protein